MLASNAIAALRELGVAERVHAAAAIIETVSVTAGPGRTRQPLARRQLHPSLRRPARDSV
jgi:2-polyprenyl-6-methoxyphenol hydroxylase-like FAD-dependent oxidoreductase